MATWKRHKTKSVMMFFFCMASKVMRISKMLCRERGEKAAPVAGSRR